MKYTDDQILECIKDVKKIDKGFRMLMDNYQSKLYHHIRILVGDHEDANDVLQNAFIKAFRNIDKFEERSSLFTWLFKIATNESMSYIENQKKRQRIIESIENHENDKYVSGNANLTADFIRAALDKAIDELPHQQKTIFSLRYFEEMSYNDISGILGVTNGSLKASYHHAVKKIENYLKYLSANEI